MSKRLPPPRRHVPPPPRRDATTPGAENFFIRTLRQMPRWKVVTGGVLLLAILGAINGGTDDAAEVETLGNRDEIPEVQLFVREANVEDPAPTATPVPPTATPVPPTPTAVPPTAVPPTVTPVPTAVPATPVPPTPVPATPVPPTAVPPTAAPAPTAVPQQAASDCHPSYTPCVPNPGYDLNCPDVGRAVQVIGPDVYRLDRDNDGRGCESYG